MKTATTWSPISMASWTSRRRAPLRRSSTSMLPLGKMPTLRRTWDLLDYLPRAEPSPSFTHRTMERLEPVVRTTMIRVRPWKRWRPLALGMGWAAAVLVAGAGGFYAMNLYQARSHRHQEQELVHDLRIIENKRLYEAVDDLEFLRELDHPDLFGDDSSGS